MGGRGEAHLGRTEHHRRVHGCACVAGTSPLSCPEEKGAIYACRRCTCALKLEKKKKKKSGGGTITTSNNINNGSRGKKTFHDEHMFLRILIVHSDFHKNFVCCINRLCALVCVCVLRQRRRHDGKTCSFLSHLSFFLSLFLHVCLACMVNNGLV